MGDGRLEIPNPPLICTRKPSRILHDFPLDQQLRFLLSEWSVMVAFISLGRDMRLQRLVGGIQTL